MNKNLNTSKNPIVVVAATAAVALVVSGHAAYAQQGSAAARTGAMNRNGATQSQSGGINGTVARRTSATGSASTFRVSANSVPGAVEPIMNRAATLLRVAEARQRNAPSEAKESYRASAQALRQLLTASRLAPGLGAGNGLASAPSISSNQVADDIRTLRASAKSSRGSQMTLLNNAASLYATGAKEYFTGQLREALFDGSVSAAPVVIRGARGGATQSTAYTPGRRRPTNPNAQQGGVIVNPPSVYNQPGNNNGGTGVVAPAFGAPIADPGTTVVAPALGGGGVIAPGTVTTGPVIVTSPVNNPTAPVAPAPAPNPQPVTNP